MKFSLLFLLPLALSVSAGILDRDAGYGGYYTCPTVTETDTITTTKVSTTTTTTTVTATVTSCKKEYYTSYYAS
jgi:hypothetical protein